MCGPPSDRRHQITHLSYLDDLKLYFSGEKDLKQSLKVVQEYTRDVGMELGADKCVVFHLRREHDDGSIFRHLDAEETYKYLGIEQQRAHDAPKVKATLRGKYRNLLRKI